MSQVLLRAREVVEVREYSNPVIWEYVQGFDEKKDRQLILDTIRWLIKTYPEIAPTLRGELVSEEIIDGRD